MRRNRLRSALIATAALSAFNHSAQAVTDYFWNPPSGGAGTWNATTQNWSTASTGPDNYTWTNSGSERANFGGSAGGAITTVGEMVPDGINITSTGYSFSGTEIVVLGGAINNTVATTINAPLGGNAGLIKTGICLPPA